MSGGQGAGESRAGPGIGNAERAARLGLGRGAGTDGLGAETSAQPAVAKAPVNSAVPMDDGSPTDAASGVTLSLENEFPDAATQKNKARSKVGIGETTWISASAPGGKWSSTGGTGKDDKGDYKWTSAKAGTFTITYTLDGKSTTQTMEVVAPDSIKGENRQDLSYSGGVHGAGMTLDLITGPTDVSFTNLGWKEEQGAIKADGVFSGRIPPINHNPKWSKMGAKNDIQDRAEHKEFPKPWEKGTVTYEIKELYSVGASGAGTEYKTVEQVHEMTGPDGTATTSKAGQKTDPRTP